MSSRSPAGGRRGARGSARLIGVEYRIALAQMAPRLGEVDVNTGCTGLLKRAADEDARLSLPRAGADRLPARRPGARGRHRADDPRLAALGPGGAGDAAGDRLRGGDRCAPLLQQRRAAARRRSARPAPQNPPADLQDVRRGTLHRGGDRIRTHPVGELDRSIGLSICEDFGTPACRCSRPSTGRGCCVNLAAGPARASGKLGRAGGDRRLAQDAGHLRAAGNGARRLLQSRRQRGGLTFWGGSAPARADGSTVAEGPL